MTKSKEILENHKNNANSIKNSEKTFYNQEQEDRYNNKVNSFVSGLSESQKKVALRQIQVVKAKDNYCDYMQLVNPTYKMTKFHKFLCQVCDSAVKRIEQNQKDLANARRTFICLSVPPQLGKGYPIDYPVLTTKGWKKHGDLEYGDYVYNDKGEQVMVLGNQKPYMHKCMKVCFATGDEHIVTREHLWKVQFSKETRKNGKHGRTRVEKIVETQDIWNEKGKNNRNPCVIVNKPLFNKEKELLIDPYILGLWLGDGISANNDIVVSKKDLNDELQGIIGKEEYKIIERKNEESVVYIRLGDYEEKCKKGTPHSVFVRKLRHYNLQNNKHIPIEYLLASESQRWELLRGLMDTDGCVSKNGTCEYCGIKETLLNDVLTLCRSLGIKAVIKKGVAKLYGKVVSDKYRVSFNAKKGNTYFKIRRKQEIVDNRKDNERVDKDEYFINKIIEVEDELVSCISVEGGMYLAGYGLIPTHNSETVTKTLPSWFIGRNPNLSAILVAYNGDYAVRFSDANRQKTREYGKEVFGIEISETQDTKDRYEIKNNKGFVYGAGINAGITGNGCELLIIDDPYKNSNEANSKTYRESISNVFKDSCLTRLHAGGVCIVIHTRWHEEDLIAELSHQDNTIVINLPLVCEDEKKDPLKRKLGETLCPELGFGSIFVEETKARVGLKVFNALYQGKPSIDGGEIFKRETIKYYTNASKPSSFEEQVISCDLSFGGVKKQNDPCAIQVWGRIGANHYLLKRIKKRMTFVEMCEMIKMISAEFPLARKKIVEKKANGQAVIDSLNSEIGGFEAYDPKMTDKLGRANAITPYFDSGNVYFPCVEIDRNIEEMVEELMKFPNSEHDDEVDAMTQYLNTWQYKSSGRLLTDSGYIGIANAWKGIKV